jgi:hypothetical protein
MNLKSRVICVRFTAPFHFTFHRFALKVVHFMIFQISLGVKPFSTQRYIANIRFFARLQLKLMSYMDPLMSFQVPFLLKTFCAYPACVELFKRFKFFCKFEFFIKKFHIFFPVLGILYHLHSGFYNS